VSRRVEIVEVVDRALWNWCDAGAQNVVIMVRRGKAQSL